MRVLKVSRRARAATCVRRTLSPRAPQERPSALRSSRSVRRILPPAPLAGSLGHFNDNPIHRPAHRSIRPVCSRPIGNVRSAPVGFSLLESFFEGIRLGRSRTANCVRSFPPASLLSRIHSSARERIARMQRTGTLEFLGREGGRIRGTSADERARIPGRRPGRASPMLSKLPRRGSLRARESVPREPRCPQVSVGRFRSLP
jgi:hypothetical protein